jgi:glycosyltransferase involved in cell wall biosynthesis
VNDDPILREGESGLVSRIGPSAPSLLMDLRPCYEGFAGIPQEARLLFAMFSGLPLRRFGGLASGVHFTSRRGRARTPYERTLEQTKVLIAQDIRRPHWPLGIDNLIPGSLRHHLLRPYIMISEALRAERLDLRIDPEVFEDYLWMKLFDNTLAPHERRILHRAEFYATELGHEYARSMSMLPRMFQRRVHSQGWDVFFAASVSPYRLAPGTRTMIRYYDALPLVSPHTVGEPWPHALSHGRMLQRNMQDGASFYCDSEPVREDLLRLFPHAEQQVHTIPVTVAPGFRPDVRSDRELRTILKRRRSEATKPDKKGGFSREDADMDGPSTAPPLAAAPRGTALRGAARPVKKTQPLPKLFMAVSTLEPRKNYLKLFRGFEIARNLTDAPMQLLIVANPGWRSEAELHELKALVKEGTYHLSGVPFAELRVLYSMAHCVVAPSRAEGFDYSGAEGLACGAPLIASGIPVHRWVYGDAAEYFDPYDEEDLGRLMARFAELPRNEGHLALLRERGLRRAAMYRPETLAPRWEAAIENEAAKARGNTVLA